MALKPHEETLNIFLMLVRKLKGKLDNDGRKNGCSEIVPLIEELKFRSTWTILSWWIPSMTTMVYFCWVGNKIDIFPWLPGAIRKRASKIETTANFSKKWGHMSIEYR